MATDASNYINYYLLVKDEHKSDLAGIRKWNNLKIAFEEKSIWVKDLDYVQVNSVEVKSIPYKILYYEKAGKLFLMGSLLPERNIPSLLWTPIERALPLKLPPFNHNYFGINEKIPIGIISSENEAPSVGMITSMEILEQYIPTAPAIRLQKIKWAVLNNDKVLLLGTPLLPVTGDVYWMRNDFIIPAGFDLDLYLLADALNNLVNPENDLFIIWNADNTYSPIDKSALQPLSLSSFRITLQHFSTL